MANKKEDIIEEVVDYPKPLKASEIKPIAPLKVINEPGQPTQVIMPS